MLLLAQLNIQTGAAQPAIEQLDGFISREPKALQAHELLGLAYLAKREPARATEAFRRFVTQAPQDPRGPYLVGIGLRAQGKPAEAKKEFEAALALAPAYVEPMDQLVGTPRHCRLRDPLPDLRQRVPRLVLPGKAGRGLE